ncbi:MAG: glycerophosphoryl diester phosphodiesterase [Pseudohongiellaceae bacterium]|jgi:glycerophosphoryl diester phosphodiesterase
MTLTNQIPTLIAHRGYSGCYPENTLLAYQAAYDCGARFVELDIQLTADLVPVLHHDRSLKRMSGVDINIANITVAQLEVFSAAYALRFNDKFSNNTFTSFQIFCEWLKNHHDVTAFVEIKQASIDNFGLTSVMQSTLKQISDTNTQSQCIVIAFNSEVIDYTQKNSTLRAGWILPAWSDKQHSIMNTLQPDFVFCDVDILPTNNNNIWRGKWEWAAYNLDDIDSAIAMAARDIYFLETNEIGTLVKSKALHPSTKINS